MVPLRQLSSNPIFSPENGNRTWSGLLGNSNVGNGERGHGLWLVSYRRFLWNPQRRFFFGKALKRTVVQRKRGGSATNGHDLGGTRGVGGVAETSVNQRGSQIQVFAVLLLPSDRRQVLIQCNQATEPTFLR